MKIAARGPRGPRAICAASARCIVRSASRARASRAPNTASEKTPPGAAGAGNAGIASGAGIGEGESAAFAHEGRAFGCAARGAAALRSALVVGGGILQGTPARAPSRRAEKEAR